MGSPERKWDGVEKRHQSSVSGVMNRLANEASGGRFPVSCRENDGDPKVNKGGIAGAAADLNAKKKIIEDWIK